MSSSVQDSATGDWRAALCQKNGHAWILNHEYWKQAYNPSVPPPVVSHGSRGFQEVRPGAFVDDAQHRGFLLLCPMSMQIDSPTHELYFILVDEDDRHQGIAAALVKRIPPDYWIWLESMDNASRQFWEIQSGFSVCHYKSCDIGNPASEFIEEFERRPLLN